jgi:predicted nucleic acid-binding Zn ribbon protein
VAEQHPHVIESGIGRTVRRDVRFDLLHPLSWQQDQRRCQRTVYADAMTE